MWDLRTPTAPVFEFEDHEDYISDFELHPDLNTLLSVSADGSLGIYNFAAGKLEAMSECLDDEILSVCTIKVRFEYRSLLGA